MTRGQMTDLFTPAAPERDVYTPTRLNREARMLLERGFGSLWLEGELSNLSRPSSGHWYFSLKDNGAQLRCAMFRQRNSLLRFAPQDGMHVLVRGRVGLYEPRGDYQFLVEHMEEGGEGALRRRFELLKAKLAAEGLFAAERKRRPPALPRRIGVITSPTGAALRDIMNVLRRRFPLTPILIYPVAVQGAQSAAQIAAALTLASARADCDVLILARGGGSLEDLWSFNEEIVVRAMAECSIPIISGIGHEIDFTIADWVADVRAPTPSGAAELAVPDAQEWLRSFEVLERRLLNTLRRQTLARREHVEWVTRRLLQLHPGIQLRQQAQRVDELEQRLTRSIRSRLHHARSQLNEASAHLRRASPALLLSAAKGNAQLLSARLVNIMRQHLEAARSRCALSSRALNSISPLATLDRGYAIVADQNGRVLVDASQVSIGDQIETRLARGSLQATVTGQSKRESFGKS
ncbi:MAG TPA: exodeoxyribonuclease VII large subunit [Steroidobacteraceae bacterium]|nr:exodeoxyribonuclease VII large subunit [Steroidobacteraceae bacterium]